jgi:hypothetical protein
MSTESPEAIAAASKPPMTDAESVLSPFLWSVRANAARCLIAYSSLNGSDGLRHEQRIDLTGQTGYCMTVRVVDKKRL